MWSADEAIITAAHPQGLHAQRDGLGAAGRGSALLHRRPLGAQPLDGAAGPRCRRLRRGRRAAVGGVASSTCSSAVLSLRVCSL